MAYQRNVNSGAAENGVAENAIAALSGGEDLLLHVVDEAILIIGHLTSEVQHFFVVFYFLYAK
jgi:hypothetical protein